MLVVRIMLAFSISVSVVLKPEVSGAPVGLLRGASIGSNSDNMGMAMNSRWASARQVQQRASIVKLTAKEFVATASRNNVV